MADGSFALPACPVFLMRQEQDEGVSFLKLSIMDNGVQVGRAVAVFSSEVLADQFQAGGGAATTGYVSMPTDNYFVLRRYFTNLAEGGVTHVNLDPVSGRADSGHLSPIEPILAAFQSEQR